MLGLLKCLQRRAQALLDSGIGSLESIPRLIKCLQIRAQATLSSGIGSLESIPRLHNMKNEDEDNFFWTEPNIFCHLALPGSGFGSRPRIQFG